MDQWRSKFHGRSLVPRRDCRAGTSDFRLGRFGAWRYLPSAAHQSPELNSLIVDVNASGGFIILAVRKTGVFGGDLIVVIGGTPKPGSDPGPTLGDTGG